MITIQCLVDNCVQHSSTLWGEHGVAFLIDTEDGRLLFDTGQSGTVLLHNTAQMNIDLGSVDALAISHAHLDHTGGLADFLEVCRPNLPLYASEDLFRPRYAQLKQENRSIGIDISQEELSKCLNLHLSITPAEMLPGVWTTGEIFQRTEFEGRSPRHGIIVDGEWQPDPYQDDFSLVVETSQGLIVICGCCHAGLLNTLAHIQRLFAGDILAIFGGTHLSSATPEMLATAIERLATLGKQGSPRLYLNHCTGEGALLALSQAFGDRVRACPAGTVMSF
ncbi:MAG: MBL fold metallo-hydrolase [Anaerolineae bacterium]|nr:MBL fold metallo-hydrolase [Anaerolineae bacterium]